jgi:hypothetical protein
LKKRGGRPFFANEWFDRDCQEKRRQTRKALRTFVHSRQNSDRDCYCAMRKEYKKLLYFKEREHKTKCRKELVNSVNDSRKFWENVKKFARKDRQIGDISEEQWLEHFKKVFAVDNVDVEEDADVTFEQIIDGGDINDDILNKNITPEEVIEAILKLKGNKAAGPDGIIPEIFKHSCKSITPFLVLLWACVC